MEIFDVFSMNGIENNPASGDTFLENVIQGGGQCYSRGGNAPPRGGGGGGVKYPVPIT